MERTGGQNRMERRARPNGTETNRTAQERERGGERERKKVQSIHKQVVACPSKRPRTLWLYTSSSAFAFHFRPSSQHPVLPYSPPFLHHASSRFRDITRGRGVAVRYVARWRGVTVHYVVRWGSVVVRYVAQGCGVAVRYVARGCGVAVRYVAWGCGVAVHYVARGCCVTGCCAVAGAQGYVTIGVAQ